MLRGSFNLLGTRPNLIVGLSNANRLDPRSCTQALNQLPQAPSTAALRLLLRAPEH